MGDHDKFVLKEKAKLQEKAKKLEKQEAEHVAVKEGRRPVGLEGAGVLAMWSNMRGSSLS